MSVESVSPVDPRIQVSLSIIYSQQSKAPTQAYELDPHLKTNFMFLSQIRTHDPDRTGKTQHRYRQHKQIRGGTRRECSIMGLLVSCVFTMINHLIILFFIFYD